MAEKVSEILVNCLKPYTGVIDSCYQAQRMFADLQRTRQIVHDRAKRLLDKLPAQILRPVEAIGDQIVAVHADEFTTWLPDRKPCRFPEEQQKVK